MATRSVGSALARAVFSLSAALSTSGSSFALSSVAGPSASAALRPLAAAPSLRELLRGLHTSSWAAAAAADEPRLPEGINPLQQAPPPGGAVSASAAMAALPGAEEGFTARAVHRGIKISPDKLNMFAKLIRGMHLEDALIQCRISPKKSAKICEKVLLSARANALNSHGLDESRLTVGEAYVGKGTHLKRVSIHGRGRSGVRHRYRSHLTIVLGESDTPRRTQIVPMLAERRKWLAGRRGSEEQQRAQA